MHKKRKFSHFLQENELHNDAKWSRKNDFPSFFLFVGTPTYVRMDMSSCILLVDKAQRQTRFLNMMYKQIIIMSVSIYVFARKTRLKIYIFMNTIFSFLSYILYLLF